MASGVVAFTAVFSGAVVRCHSNCWFDTIMSTIKTSHNQKDKSITVCTDTVISIPVDSGISDTIENGSWRVDNAEEKEKEEGGNNEDYEDNEFLFRP